MQSSERPEVSAVVVSFNTRELTRRCLKSLFRAREEASLEVIVVDNASEDGSAEMIRGEFPAARLIASTENLGFAAGNNRAFAVATGRYMLLLNPDAELQASALRRLLDFAAQNRKAGVIGPRVFLPSGEQQSTVMRFPRLADVFIGLFVPNSWARRSRLLGKARYTGLDLSVVQSVQVIAGCCMLVPREVIETVGGMDERFFMYGEEVEWCHRIGEAGWSILYFPGAAVLHAGGQSARQRPDSMTIALARSQLRVLAMIRGPRAAAAANLLMLIRDIPRAALWTLLSLSPSLRQRPPATRLRAAAVRLPSHVRWVFQGDWSS